MYWVGAIVAIGLLIIVHEAGHFVVARWCKMSVERFSLGFGPALFKWRRWGTTFQIAPIPFGGFVEIRGMTIAEEVERDDVNAYPNRPVWQRIATIFAGPATNYLFAIVLAIIVYIAAGVPSGTAWYGVRGTQENFDAHGKLETGDRILAIDDETLYFTYEGEPQARTLPTIVNEIGTRSDGAEPAHLTVLRDGVELPIDVMLTFEKFDKPDPKTPEITGRYRLGIDLEYQPERVSVGFFASIGHALYYPVEQTKLIGQGLYRVITGEEKGEVSGAVGITAEIKRAFEIGWVSLLELLMVLNVYLGMFNLFPLPALDGGRLVFLGYEMVTRRRANPKIEATVHMVGILVLLVVMVLVTYKDCAKLL
jgi:regulator of sigma E protease